MTCFYAHSQINMSPRALLFYVLHKELTFHYSSKVILSTSATAWSNLQFLTYTRLCLQDE